MDQTRTLLDRVARWAIVVACALILQAIPEALAGGGPPKWFPTSGLVSGDGVLETDAQEARLVHAQWYDDDGNAVKYFIGKKKAPWPKALKMPASDSFRIYLDGVRWPGEMQLGVYRRTGQWGWPEGKHELFQCTADAPADEPCRWVPTVKDGEASWEIVVRMPQKPGNYYMVGVGTWPDPADEPPPLGTDEHIATWLYRAKVTR